MISEICSFGSTNLLITSFTGSGPAFAKLDNGEKKESKEYSKK